MIIKQTGYRPGNTATPCIKTSASARIGHPRTAMTGVCEAYFFCEIGDDLYAIMLFPLRDEVVTVTLLLGPIDDCGEDMVDLSTALALLEGNSFSGNDQALPEKKMPVSIERNNRTIAILPSHSLAIYCSHVRN